MPHRVLICACFSLFALGDSLADTSFRRYLRDLGSSRDANRQKAEAALIKGGDKAAIALGDYLNTQSKTYRRAAYEFLPRIPGDAAGAVLAERAMVERNDELRATAIAILKKNPSAGARQHLLKRANDDKLDHRRRAVSVISQLNDPAYLDALIDRLAEEAAAGKSGGGLGLNVGVSRLDGFDTYRRTYVVRGPNGPQKINQDIRMPRVSGTSLSTKVGLPAAQALVTITGQDFGTDVDKWRQWRQKRYPRSK